MGRSAKVGHIESPEKFGTAPGHQGFFELLIFTSTLLAVASSTFVLRRVADSRTRQGALNFLHI
jgi:hypothetical protein